MSRWTQEQFARLAGQFALFELRRGFTPHVIRAEALENDRRIVGRPLKRGESICDDGFVYRWEERSEPWYAVTGLDHGRAGIFRRGQLDLPALEATAWRFAEHLAFVRRRVARSIERLRSVDAPFYVENEKYVYLKIVSGFEGGYAVTPIEKEPPKDVVSKIGLIPIDGALEAGVNYKQTSAWSAESFGRMAMLERLLGLAFDDLLDRTLGERHLTSNEFRTRRIAVMVNGRRYLVFSRETDRRFGGWPHPNDLVLDGDTPPTRPRFFHGMGQVAFAPLVRPKRTVWRNQRKK